MKTPLSAPALHWRDASGPHARHGQPFVAVPIPGWCRSSLLIVISLVCAIHVAAESLQAQVSAQAVAGRPFGVGRIELTLPPNEVSRPLGYEGLSVSEKSGRVLYPAIKTPPNNEMVKNILTESPLMRGGPLRQQIGGIIRDAMEAPPKLQVFFLFTGDEPLEMTLDAARPIRLRVVPGMDPRVHDRLLQAWWSIYAADKSSGLFKKKPAYPPLIENYLTSTLARRLMLKLPPKKQTPPWRVELEQYLGIALGTESIRMGMIQDRILGLNNLDLPADQPLPEPLPLPEGAPFPGELAGGGAASGDQPGADEPVEIEPLATRVPAECFYIRWGRYSNLLWFQDTLAKWGGDLQNLIAVRGLDQGMGDVIERQLVLKQTVLSRMFGDAVIADVALIGTDIFFREGASHGMLFRAHQPAVLASSLKMNRREKIDSGEAQEQTVKIAGRDVSLLKSSDGSIRSYFLADGEYILATSSRYIMERFIQLGEREKPSDAGGDAGSAGPPPDSLPAGEGTSLASLPEFHLARRMMPLSRGDTLFIYFSRPFLETLASPRYRVEMARRLQAHADIELVRLAVLAAAAEGKPAGTIEELIEGRTLPPEFGPRPDGSRTILTAEGDVYDDLRGHYGAFLPVPDTPVGRVTRAEASAVLRFQDQYLENWGGQMDPIMVGITRQKVNDELDRVTIDAQARPFSASHYDMLGQLLGPPVPDRVAPMPGDIAAGEVMLANQRLFGGARDVIPPVMPVGGRLMPYGRLRDFVVGYLGTKGPLGPLASLNAWIAPAEALGERIGRQLGLWRRQRGDWTVFSFQPEVLMDVMPRLTLVPAERPAQFRLNVGDIWRAQITPLVNQLSYSRTRETSLSNLRLLHQVQQQLHVPPDSSLKAAEFLLGAELYCPLGGDYVLRQGPGGREQWTSTALEGQRDASPDVRRGPAPRGRQPAARTAAQPYQAPPLRWFRGLKADAIMNRDQLGVHAELLMESSAELGLETGRD